MRKRCNELNCRRPVTVTDSKAVKCEIHNDAANAGRTKYKRAVGDTYGYFPIYNAIIGSLRQSGVKV